METPIRQGRHDLLSVIQQQFSLQSLTEVSVCLFDCVLFKILTRAMFYLIFRYQRLVPGRENIAAEHLVPQLGYVATSKNEPNHTQALM